MIDATGTCFHGVTIRATVGKMMALLGTPSCDENTGEDKVNYEWVRRLHGSKDVYAIYDWKEYRVLAESDVIEWHIGTRSAAVAHAVKEELTEAMAMVSG